MYFLQLYFLQETQRTIDNSWMANIVTGGVIIAVIGFFMKRLINEIDDRFKTLKQETDARVATLKTETDARFAAQDKKVDHVDERSDKIEQNYKKEFSEVRKEVNYKADDIKNHLSAEIRELSHQKNNNWQRQALQNGETTNELKNIGQAIKEIKDIIFK